MSESLPGIVLDLPDADYHRIDRASSSALRKLRQGKSPAHLRHDFDHPIEPTPAMEFGTALHQYLFQFEEMGRSVVLKPDWPRRKKADKERWETWEAEHQDIPIHLSSEQYDALGAMADKIDRHERLQSLWRHPHKSEVTVFCDMEIFDVDATEMLLPSKARLDLWIPDLKCIVDLKTTTDASPRAFAKTVANWGYHWQAAFYSLSLAQHGHSVEDYLFIAAEKSPPYQVAVYRLDDEVLARAHQEMQGAMRRLALCYETGDWPGYYEDIQTLTLPPWAFTYEED